MGLLAEWSMPVDLSFEIDSNDGETLVELRPASHKACF